MTNIPSIEADRICFFERIREPSIGLRDLLRFYIGYTGPLFTDQKKHIKHKLKTLFDTQGLQVLPEHVFGPRGEIKREFLSLHFPDLVPLYFDEGALDNFEQRVILPASVNELYDPSLPHPINQRSGRRDRPAFSALTRSKGSLYISPHGYQYFDGQERRYWPGATLWGRIYSTDILQLPKMEMRGTIVLIQDYGNGSNFAHFLFDWITRIMLLLEDGNLGTGEPTFIMGGNRSEFHDRVLGALEKIYGLNPGCFHFPQEKSTIDIQGKFVFLSDQTIAPMHPAQMAHQRSVSLIKRLGKCLPSGSTNTKRIFISRQDAKLRRLQNEEELVAIATKHGFVPVRMSEHPFAEQLSIVRGAEFIVAPHGMGMTYIGFHDGPVSILELFHPNIGTDAYSMISRALGFRYDFILGAEVGDNQASYHIPANDFAHRLEKLLG